MGMSKNGEHKGKNGNFFENEEMNLNPSDCSFEEDLGKDELEERAMKNGDYVKYID
jgi:hypothetical protein